MKLCIKIFAAVFFAGIALFLYSFRRHYYSVLHPSPSRYHVVRSQKLLDEGFADRIRVITIKWVDSDAPGFVALVESRENRSPGWFKSLTQRDSVASHKEQSKGLVLYSSQGQSFGFEPSSIGVTCYIANSEQGIFSLREDYNKSLP